MKKLPKSRESPLEGQIKRLRMRVSFLERALSREKQGSGSLFAVAEKRDDSEQDARRKAFAEYYRQREIQYYLKNPHFLRIVSESEKQRNAFLKSRGLKPEPSSIPEQFRRGLKKYRAKD